MSDPTSIRPGHDFSATTVLAAFLKLEKDRPHAFLLESVEGGETIASAKHLAAYYDRHAQRSSFKNTMPPPPPQQQAKPDERKAGAAA